MKKHIHRLIASILIGTTMLSVTACGNNKTVDNGGSISQNIPMGRYVEENLELPEDIKSIISYEAKKDGVMHLYGYDTNGKVAVYVSKDNKSWEKEEAKWLQGIVDSGNMVSQIAYDKEGTPYVLYQDNQFALHVAKVKDGEALEEIPFSTEEQGYPQGMEVLDNGDILIGIQSSGVLRINGVDGQVVTEYMNAGTDGSFTTTNSELMLIDAQKGGVVRFNLETGLEEGFIPYEGSIWGSKILSNEEGSTYLINEGGISRLAPGGSIWENIIEGQISSFGMPSLYLRDVALKGSDEFTVIFNNQTEGYQVISYTFDPSAPARPTTEVNLYMLEDNMTIRQAVAEYQRQNPEVFINMQIGMTQGDTITKSDAIRTLNTQLLAGKGPDILLLDGLPIQSYIDKGVLLDMSDWAGEKLDSGEWLTNIVGSYKEEDGSIYALPTRFTVPTLWGNSEIVNGVSSVEELAEWAQQNPDKQVFYPMPPEILMEKLYGITAHTWLDEKGQIKEDAFIRFIEAVNVLADTDAEADQSEMEIFTASPMQTNDNKYSILDTLSTEYMANKDIEVHLQNIRGFMRLPYYNSAILNRGDGDFRSAFNKEGGVFNPVGVIGINANSKQQDIARDIVELAMSSEVQKVELGDGLPIHKEVFDKQSQVGSEQSMMAMTMAIEKPFTMVPASQESYTKFKEEVEKLQTPTMTDEILISLIIEETKGYFNGEKTAEEAAAAAAKRTRAYLAE